MKDRIKQAVQVCYQIDEDNINREIGGLRDVMMATNALEVFIVTLYQKDDIERIPILPAWEFIE